MVWPIMGGAESWIAMLGVLRWEVNEGSTAMDAGKGKSRDVRLSQALAYPVVQKAACSDLYL
jgi:hypothetical protein